MLRNDTFIKELYTRIITGTVLIVCGTVCFFLFPLLFSTVFMSIILLIFFFELPRLFSHNLWLWLLTPLWLLVPSLMLIYMNHGLHRLLVVYMILSIACADTCAYFAGIYWGRHKIIPKISPGKSWEGLFGAIFGCFILLLFLQYFSCASLNIFFAAWFSIVIVLVGTAGDFFESYIKRCAKVKDSGTLLPGHGGLLDRFDALLFVIPLWWALQHYLAQQFCL